MAERRKFTRAERKQVYEKCNGHCAYCGCEISLNEMQVDHVIPLYSWNGPGGTNDMDNLLPACRSCNHYKSTMDLETFREMLQGIPDRLLRDSSTFRIGMRFALTGYCKHKIKFYFEVKADG